VLLLLLLVAWRPCLAPRVARGVSRLGFVSFAACALLRHHGIRSEVFAFSGARAGASVLELLAAYLDKPSSATQRWERVCAMMRVPPGRVRLRAGPPAKEGPSFPVYLQYQGHAVLVVGVCGAAGAPADALVVLDPAERRLEDKRRAGAGGPRLARIAMDALARRQEYELLIVHHSEFFCSSPERELAKTMGIAPVKSD
jgi:hypothetical protein